VTPIVVSSELYGDSFAVLHAINTLGCIVAMGYAPPIGTKVALHFVQELQGSPVGMSVQALVMSRPLRTQANEHAIRIELKFEGEWT
jgi:hypothetical protein